MLSIDLEAHHLPRFGRAQSVTKMYTPDAPLRGGLAVFVQKGPWGPFFTVDPRWESQCPPTVIASGGYAVGVASLAEKNLARAANASEGNPFDDVVGSDVKALGSQRIGILLMESELAAVAAGAILVDDTKLIAFSTEYVGVRWCVALQVRRLIDTQV